MRFSKGILALSLALLTAPFWLPFVQSISGRNIFLTQDSLALTGCALLAGWLLQYVALDRQLKFVDSVVRIQWTRIRWTIWILAPLLFFTLYLINHYVFRAFMNSGDEHSCYFLAECIRNWKWWATPHPLPEFFEVVHVGNRGGKWFSVYPPGWPLLFALGLEWGVADWVNPILATLATLLLFKVAVRMFGFQSACLGVTLMVTTPFFLFNNASYFSHTTCLLMVAIFLYAGVRWEERKGLAWAGLAALAVGYGAGTRYLTMVAVAGPFIFYRLVRVAFRREKWTISHLVFSLILLIMLGLNLYYNYLITGRPIEPPNHYHHNWERLGFQSEFSPLTALTHVLFRFFYLIDWIPALLVGFYIAAIIKDRNLTSGHQIFRLGFLYLPVAYMFYYSWGGNQYGPRYYFEGLPFLCFTVGDAVRSWWWNGTERIRKFLLGALIVTMAGNLYTVVKHGVYYYHVSSERQALYKIAEEKIREPAVVFIRGFLGDTLVMSQEDAVRNHPDLDSKILYAHDLGGSNELLKEFYPNRQYYFGYYDRKLKKARLEAHY